MKVFGANSKKERLKNSTLFAIINTQKEGL